MAGALAGTTVLEVASYVAGPYAGVLLADMGATVIKVEAPPDGAPAYGHLALRPPHRHLRLLRRPLRAARARAHGRGAARGDEPAARHGGVPGGERRALLCERRGARPRRAHPPRAGVRVPRRRR